MNLKKGKTVNGFSIIETLLVITLLSTMGIIASIAYSRTINQNAVITTQNYLAATLKKAQMYAMTSRNNGNWGVNLSGNTLTLFQGSTFAGRTLAFDETYTVNSNVVVTGLTDVIFTKTTGKPASSASIIISSQNNTKTITVNSEGNVDAN